MPGGTARSCRWLCDAGERYLLQLSRCAEWVRDSLRRCEFCRTPHRRKLARRNDACGLGCLSRSRAADGITPTAYSAPRMSPAVSLRLPAPPLFRCAEHTIDVIQTRSAGSTGTPVIHARWAPDQNDPAPGSRRSLLLAAPDATAGLGAAAARDAVPARFRQSPRPSRTEWWYITGRVRRHAQFGHQVTFFRSRVEETQGMQSAFAAKQLIFAHAAVTDLAGGTHDQRIARAEKWACLRRAKTIPACICATGHSCAARKATAPALPPTDSLSTCALRPRSRRCCKATPACCARGLEEAQASYYYSEPQLATSGKITLQGAPLEVRGTAWLDHEWTEFTCTPRRGRLDWLGMNLADGSALTAFRMRLKPGGVLWAGGSFRSPGGIGGVLRAGRSDVRTPA